VLEGSCGPPGERGRLAGFEELYASQSHTLTMQINAHVGDLTEAQDLVQEAFCRALPRWEKLAAMGVGQVRNRLPKAVERTVPFGTLVQSLVILGVASGHHPEDVTARRLAEPWYDAKTEPSFEDMITARMLQGGSNTEVARVSVGDGRCCWAG
jgi:hypothetical protein